MAENTTKPCEKCKECIECNKIDPDELKKHDNPGKSLWIVIRGYVYDISKFCREHPGGEEILYENAGKDATIAFDDVGHSVDALRILESLKIGKLAKKCDCAKKDKPT